MRAAGGGSSLLLGVCKRRPQPGCLSVSGRREGGETSVAIFQGLKMGREVTAFSGFSGMPLQGVERWGKPSPPVRWPSGRLVIAFPRGWSLRAP